MRSVDLSKGVTVDSLDRARYLPHHTVKKELATTPIRVVFECSSQSLNTSPSLNNCLMMGPPFLSHMCSIIVRFQSFTYGLSTDIKKAFLYVSLDENDRLNQIFLVVRPYESRKQIISFSFQEGPLWINQFPFHVECYPASSSGRLHFTCSQTHKRPYVCEQCHLGV